LRLNAFPSVYRRYRPSLKALKYQAGRSADMPVCYRRFKSYLSFYIRGLVQSENRTRVNELCRTLMVSALVHMSLEAASPSQRIVGERSTKITLSDVRLAHLNYEMNSNELGIRN
jgi:hypothetical protein